MPIFPIQCYECRVWRANTEMVPMLRGLFICKTCLALCGEESREAQEARNLAVVLNHLSRAASVGYPRDEWEAEKAMRALDTVISPNRKGLQDNGRTK